MQRNTPAQQKDLEDKAIKTAILLGALNVIASPLWLTSSAGLLLTVAANALVIYKFNEIGERRRPGNNMLARGQTFFSTYLPNEYLQPNEVENSLRNVINGGAAVFDEITSAERRMSR
jgi:hypothetical protein